MATNTLISPGVLELENDQSFIAQQPVTVGAAIIGPTVKGPVEVPTIVTSWSDYQNKFGSTFLSGSSVYSYFTSIAAYNYFLNGGQTMLVARVTTGSFTSAYTSGSTSNGSAVLNISGTLAVNKGGTGQTSYTDGQLLIGNSSGNTLTKNTLGAGSNIGITNGNGTISVSLSSSLSGLTNVDTTALTGTNVLVNGSLKVSGSLARSIVTVNASYTVNSTDQVVFASVTSSGDVVVTLPSPQQVDGREIVVKRSDDATQTGIVVVSSSVFIDDSNEYELAGGYQSITLVANSGSNKWFVV